ncbi:29734_t:CDS:2, partial [Gigaspora margarita]
NKTHNKIDEYTNRKKKVLKAARQRISKIQPIEGIISLQVIKRKMNLLQDVVEAQTDFVDRLKEVNNEGTLENVFRTESEELSQGADQNIQIEELSQNTDQNIQIETEEIRTQQMEVDKIGENLEKGKENIQKMDTEEISIKKGLTKQGKSYPIVQFL